MRSRSFVLSKMDIMAAPKCSLRYWIFLVIVCHLSFLAIYSFYCKHKLFQTSLRPAGDVFVVNKHALTLPRHTHTVDENTRSRDFPKQPENFTGIYKLKEKALELVQTEKTIHEKTTIPENNPLDSDLEELVNEKKHSKAQKEQEHSEEKTLSGLTQRFGHQETNQKVKRPVISLSLRHQLKNIGLEPVEDNKFKSLYIINPKIYALPKTDNLVSREISSSTSKLISLYMRPYWFTGPAHTYNMDNKVCAYRCEVDLDGSKASQADVLVIFTGYLNGSWPLPSPRPSGQIWVHLSLESPVHYGYAHNYDDWRSVFNWTWTYRNDSDIFSPYGFFSWRHKDLLLKTEDYVTIAKSKTRTATQFASHCGSQSGRDNYVRRMQEYIDVDVYGKCGTLQCPKSEDNLCEAKINKTYMFYLSFENSFCDDYVTEKFFRLFSKRLHAIPVVRGGANYTKFFPKGTFVNAADFSSAEELALYLRKLSQNTLAYAQMLKEKDKLVSSVYLFDWCQICEKVHTDKRKTIIPDIKAWSHYEGVCSEPPN